MANTEQRLMLLEKSNRRLRLAIVGVCALIGAAVLLGTAQDAKGPEELRARSVRIVNAEGTTVAMLDSSGLNGRFRLFGKDKKERVTIDSTITDNGSLSIRDGQERVVVSVMGGEGGGVVVTSDSKGESLLKLGSSRDGKGVMCNFDKIGNPDRFWP